MYNELRDFSVAYGFTNSKASHGGAFKYFLVYVDDLLVTGNISAILTIFIKALSNRFSLKDLGDLHYFLGVEVIITTLDLFISQHKYIHDLLGRTKMDGAKNVLTPLSTNEALIPNDSSLSANATEYR